MKRDRMRFLRNIGIAAHIDAGKTTLTERILYYTGKSHRIGETHDGNSQMDTLRQEIKKGITISSAATHTEWAHANDQYRLNIIDTPGHVDFMIEVERSLRVLDGLVALFDAVAGVESQTETIWQQAARYKIPIIAMVNKMDRNGADFAASVQQMRNQLGANAIPIQMPIFSNEEFVGLIDLIEWQAIQWDKEGQMSILENIPQELRAEAEEKRQYLLEAIALFDENLMEQYLEDEASIEVAQLNQVLRQATLTGQIVPVVMGAAYKNKGVQTLLDAICLYLPSPLDRGEIEGQSPQENTVLSRAPSVEAPFTGFAFKIVLDDQNRQLSFFRIYSGSLKVGDQVLNPRTGKKERVGRLYQVHSNKRKEIDLAEAGDIVATVGWKSVITGDTLCAVDHPIVLESLVIPPPVINVAIEAKSTGQLDKLGLALSKLQLEDPSFRVEVDQTTGQTILHGLGELHLEIKIDKLLHDFGIEVLVGPPKVAYQEVFTQTIHHRYRLKKQSGGPGLFAEIEVIVGPADPEFLESDAFQKEGKRLQLINKIVGGSIPSEFIPAIANGFRKVLNDGPLSGYPIQSLKVELLDGATHRRDSNAWAFELCAIETFREIAESMEPKLLEPIVSVEVHTPEEYMGTILGGLNRRRGQITGQVNQNRGILIEAEVPLAEMLGYIDHLRTVSAGRANFSMKFDHYALLPDRIAENLQLAA